MSNYIDLTGKRFGKLLVISRAENDKWGSKWLCKCDCGKEKKVRASSLIRGVTQSCGCYQLECASYKNRIETGLSSKRRVYGNYNSNAKKKNHCFELTFDQLINLVQQPCHYCRSLPFNTQKPKSNSGNFIYNGIDRKDNTKGYTIENCVPCCKYCNGAKSSKSYEEFMLWIETLVSYQNLINTNSGGK